MVQTFSDDKFIYSVDMMFAFINLFRKTLMLRKLDVNAFADTLKYKGWGDGTSGRNYSALQVLANPKKYPDEMRRIKHANLSYPIIFLN